MVNDDLLELYSSCCPKFCVYCIYPFYKISKCCLPCLFKKKFERITSKFRPKTIKDFDEIERKKSICKDEEEDYEDVKEDDYEDEEEESNSSDFFESDKSHGG